MPNPELSVSFLLEPGEAGTPGLRIGYYNRSRGLLAGYQSTSGKRILSRAKFLASGAVAIAAAHVSSSTGQVELFVGRPKQTDGGTGQRVRILEVGGVDILASIRDGASRS